MLRPGEPLYLFQLGDNALEELFSELRTLTHQRGMDSVQYRDNLGVVAQLAGVYERNPDLKRQATRLSVRDDRDRPFAVKVESTCTLPHALAARLACISPKISRSAKLAGMCAQAIVWFRHQPTCVNAGQLEGRLPAAP